MSNMINALDSNGVSFQFSEFVKAAQSARNGKSIVRFLGEAGTATVREVAVSKSDSIGKLCRDTRVKTANDVTRQIFRQSVAAMFGGEENIPRSVKKAMLLADYDKGKPLSARRIIAVQNAVAKSMLPATLLPMATVAAADQPQAGVLTSKAITAEGYAPGELTKLNNVAEILKQATRCSDENAREAALNPKSNARRLFSYGGVFTSGPENFKKGLKLLEAFDEWFTKFITSKDNMGRTYRIDNADRLSVEKFMFEEIACNAKLDINTEHMEDLFNKNPALEFIQDRQWEGLTGTLTGISPEKRSVVFALAHALRDDRAFKLHSALVARILANFQKAADVVYSGNLNRTTAFNALFTDLKALGLTASSQNMEIRDRVIDFQEFDGEMQESSQYEDNKSKERHDDLRIKVFHIQNMFNLSGATIQECKNAALEGRTLANAPGMSVVTGSLGDACGFTDSGKNQFLGDINRPKMPVYKGNPAIKDEDNVFRFTIGKQKFTSKTTQKTDDPQNGEIATAIAKFCNLNAHPAQTNAVFFALAQGGLSGQVAIPLNTGYGGSDHGPLNCKLDKDADTGAIKITYSNPNGSPVEFSWTATIDVDGKVESTPVVVTKTPPEEKPVVPAAKVTGPKKPVVPAAQIKVNEKQVNKAEE